MRLVWSMRVHWSNRTCAVSYLNTWTGNSTTMEANGDHRRRLSKREPIECCRSWWAWARPREDNDQATSSDKFGCCHSLHRMRRTSFHASFRFKEVEKKEMRKKEEREKRIAQTAGPWSVATSIGCSGACKCVYLVERVKVSHSERMMKEEEEE